MDPSSILLAINAAKSAIDAAVKVEDNFFSPTSSGKSSTGSTTKTTTTIEALQSEIESQKTRLAEVATEVAENRAIVQAQNEIIIGVSNALKVTAETVQRLRIITFVAAGVSVVSVLAWVYALAR